MEEFKIENIDELNQVLNMLGNKNDIYKYDLLTYLSKLDINSLIKTIYLRGDYVQRIFGKYKVNISTYNDKLFEVPIRLYVDIYEFSKLIIDKFEINDDRDKLELINMIK